MQPSNEGLTSRAGSFTEDLIATRESERALLRSRGEF